MRRKYVLFGSVLFLLFCLSVLMPAQSWPKNSGGVWVFYHADKYPNDSAVELVNRLTSGQDYIDLKDRLQEYKDRGAEYIRLWIPWSVVEPVENVWDFSKINLIIDAIVEKGFKLDIQLCTQMYPQWYIEEIESDPTRYLHCYKDNSGIHPETDLEPPKDPNAHQLSDRKVQSPHLSIWSTEAVERTTTLIHKSYVLCLKNWADHILYVRVSPGRLNEPTYPDKDRFWHYDEHARADFASKYPGIPFPEDPENLTDENHRLAFMGWYRRSKRIWIKRITLYLSYKIDMLPGEQKLIWYVAGDGDVYDKQDSVAYYNKYINDGWDSLNEMPQNYLRHMEDNRWIFELCQEHNAGGQSLWFVQYAGVGELVGAGTGCAKMMGYAQEEGYTGPVYAQIPKLTKDGSLINFDNVQRNICELGYWGLSWNKDSDLTHDPGLEPKKLPWEKLEQLWSSQKPAYVVPVYPINSAETNTFKPIFSWNALDANPAVIEYEIQVFNIDGEAIIPPTNVGNVTNWEWNSPSPEYEKLSCNSSYSWKLRAKNWCGWGDWSSYEFFETPGKPEAPVLIKPIDDEVTNTRQPVFKWNPAESIRPVTNYQIWIFEIDGTEVLKTQVGDVTEWQIGFKLEPNKGYYWRLRAYNECGWGSWSSDESFNTPN